MNGQYRHRAALAEEKMLGAHGAHNTAAMGSSYDMQRELRMRPDVIQATDAGGSTLLHWAAASANADTLCTLLQHDGANACLNSHDKSGRAPLTLAAGRGRKGRESVDLLLHYGAHVDASSVASAATAADPRNMQVLLEHAAKQGVQREQVVTAQALERACRHNAYECIALMLRIKLTPAPAASAQKSFLSNNDAKRLIDLCTGEAARNEIRKWQRGDVNDTQMHTFGTGDVSLDTIESNMETHTSQLSEEIPDDDRVPRAMDHEPMENRASKTYTLEQHEVERMRKRRDESGNDTKSFLRRYGLHNDKGLFGPAEGTC